jgi:hypothetical protein
MTEADLTSQIVGMMEVFYIAGSITFSVISAYIIALYYFLHRSPWVMKIGAFSFFTLTLFYLGMSTYGAVRHYDGLLKALEELRTHEGLSALGNMALEPMADSVATYSQSVAAVVIIGLWITLAYLTFLHRWRDRED